MSTPAIVVLDDDDPMLGGYAGLRWPRNWMLRHGTRAPQADLYNRVFEEYPDEPWYGILADDVMPQTMAWDVKLAFLAMPHYLAAPAGSHDPNIAPHFCLGGNLVREMGWLCLPGLDRIYVDTVWNDLAKARGVFRDVPSVVLEHWHFSNGKALVDETYRKYNKEQDKEIYEAWKFDFGITDWADISAVKE